MANLIILLLVWCTGMVLCYAWYLAFSLHRAFREEVVVEPVGTRAADEARSGDVLSYARPPRKIGLSRKWPVFQVIVGVVIVLVPMAIPVAILLGLGIADIAQGVLVPCGAALGLVLVGAAVVAGGGLRDDAGRPAAANWRYRGWVVLGWVGVMALTWGLLEWRVQRMMDAVLARAEALGTEIEIVSEQGSAAAALYTKAGVMPNGQFQFDDGWELVAADGQMAAPPPFPQAHAFRIPLLREAAAMPVSGFVPRASTYSINTLLRHLAGMRQAAVLLHRHALSEARAGRIRSAIDDINALRGMADHAGQGLCLVEVLVGTGIHALADDALQHVLPMVEDARELERFADQCTQK